MLIIAAAEGKILFRMLAAVHISCYNCLAPGNRSSLEKEGLNEEWELQGAVLQGNCLCNAACKQRIPAFSM